MLVDNYLVLSLSAFIHEPQPTTQEEKRDEDNVDNEQVPSAFAS